MTFTDLLMPLPLIPVLLALGGLWLLSSSDKSSPDAGGSGGAGPFPGESPPEGGGNGSGSTPDAPGGGGTGTGSPDPGARPQGPFFAALEASPYRSAIADAEAANGLPQNLLGRVLWQESRLNPDVADHRNSNGTVDEGIAQINSDTARSPGYDLSPLTDPHNPDTAIPFAAQYLRALNNTLGGDWEGTLQAYNGGIGNVENGTVSEAARRYASAILADVETPA